MSINAGNEYQFALELIDRLTQHANALQDQADNNRQQIPHTEIREYELGAAQMRKAADEVRGLIKSRDETRHKSHAAVLQEEVNAYRERINVLEGQRQRLREALGLLAAYFNRQHSTDWQQMLEIIDRALKST